MLGKKKYEVHTCQVLADTDENKCGNECETRTDEEAKSCS